MWCWLVYVGSDLSAPCVVAWLGGLVFVNVSDVTSPFLTGLLGKLKLDKSLRLYGLLFFFFYKVNLLCSFKDSILIEQNGPQVND